MKVETDFGTYEVFTEAARYLKNDNLAISLTNEGDCSPFARLTVNFPDEILQEDEAFIDINNCPWAEEFIRKNNLGKFTGVYKKSGWVSYPLYIFDLDKLV